MTPDQHRQHAEKIITIPRLTKVTVNLIPAALDAVNQAAHRSGDTSTEVINRAVQLYNAVTALTPGDAIQYDDHGRQITLCRAATEPTDDR